MIFPEAHTLICTASIDIFPNQPSLYLFILCCSCTFFLSFIVSSFNFASLIFCVGYVAYFVEKLLRVIEGVFSTTTIITTTNTFHSKFNLYLPFALLHNFSSSAPLLYPDCNHFYFLISSSFIFLPKETSSFVAFSFCFS